MEVKMKKLSLILFISIGLFLTGCSTTPPVHVTHTKTETKTEKVVDSGIFTFPHGKYIEPTNRTPFYKGAYVGYYGIYCTEKSKKAYRNVNLLSDGRTRYGRWSEFEEVKGSEESCIDRFMSQEKINFNNDHISLYETTVKGPRLFVTHHKNSKILKIVFVPKDKDIFITKPGYDILTDKINLTKGGISIRLPTKKLRFPISIGNKSTTDEVVLHYVCTVSLAHHIMEHIKRNHFKNVHVNTLNIDSHYPFHGSKVTFEGNPPSKRQIVSRYVKHPVLFDEVMRRFNFSYVDGSACCGQSQMLYFPGRYTIKVVHPSYHFTTQSINVNANSGNFDIFMSELGTKHRVKIVDY